MVLKYFNWSVNELRVILFYFNLNGLINKETSLRLSVSFEMKLDALYSGPNLDHKSNYFHNTFILIFD
jgi:hypothetical protein